MIITLLLHTIQIILNWLTGFLPDASVLPWGVDTTFANGVAYFHYLQTYLPPLATLMTAFMIYMGFLLTLKIIGLVPIIKNILN